MKRISLIIGLMGFALLGVMAMQFYFLYESYKLKSEIFDHSVSEALSSVVAKVEKQDAINFMERMKMPAKKHIYPQRSGNYSHYVYDRIPENIVNPFSSQKQHLHPEIERKQRKIANLKDSLKNLSEQKNNREDIVSYQQVNIEQYIDEIGRLHSKFTEVINPKLSSQLRQQLQPRLNKYDTARFMYNDPQIGPTVVSVPTINPVWLKEQRRLKKEQTFKRIKKLLEDSVHLMKAKLITPQRMNVFEKVAEEYQKADEPLGTRIDRLLIDSLLRFELQNKNIFLPFSYEITNASNDSLIYSNAQNISDEKPVFLQASSYQTPIFTKEVVNDPG
ncbi:MAG: hypothetical protein EOP42_18135, partial [Sphingobacteriaceae bacterium]